MPGDASGAADPARGPARDIVSRRLRRLWGNLPAIFALALLAVQLSIPWSVTHFVTQDGPSHLYAATVLRELATNHKASLYSPLYTVQHAPIPNWTATLLLAATSWLAGPDHAEALFASLCMLVGFAGWCYASRGVSPLANALLQVWFLWMGFYNFYLGMMLLPYLIGFYVRRAGRLTWAETAILSAELAGLLLTHLVPALLAGVTLALIAAATAPRREIRMIAAASVPASILLALYIAGVPHDLSALHSEVARAWHDFPSFFFLTGPGRYGEQWLLRRFLLVYTGAALLLLKKEEWRSPTGGLAAAVAAAFLLYLFLPDRGFAGSMVKIRFSWGVFFLGSILAWSVVRLRVVRTPVACFLAVLVALNLRATEQSARHLSGVAVDYLAAAQAIPQGACFVRLKYSMPGAPSRFGYEGLGVDPLFHLDGLVAARRRALDLSDYEAISTVFPVVYKSSIGPGFRFNLWAMEGPRDWMVGVLDWLGDNFPARIQYVIVVGDPAAPESVGLMGMPPMLAHLDAQMQLLGTSPSGLVRVYGRRGAALH